MPTLVGRIWDGETGRTLAARVQVVASSGQLCAPVDSILKVGSGDPFFYADGEFLVSLPSGQADVLVERGTEYRPTRAVVRVPRSGNAEIDLILDRWTNLASRGWYAGNTHIHYDEKETRPLERLRLDPRGRPAGLHCQPAAALATGVRLERVSHRPARVFLA
jgi:hypothetical protein